MLLNVGLEEALEWERTRGQYPTNGTGFRFPTETYIDLGKYPLKRWPLGLDLHQEPEKLKIDPGLGILNLPLSLSLLPPSILLFASLSLSYLPLKVEEITVPASFASSRGA